MHPHNEFCASDWISDFCSSYIKAEEAYKAKDAQKQEATEAKLAAVEEARSKAEEAKKVKQVEKSLKQIEKTCEQLRAGKIETKEAIQKLSDITERIAK